MTSLIRDQISFTRMKSIIPNRLSFNRHLLSKAADVSDVANSDGHGIPPPSTVNVVLFGETGVGKSSVINLIARREVAKVSSDVNGCTMQSTQYDIEFDGSKFSIFDTIGLEEPQMGVNGYLKAIERAYELISKLDRAGGVHLLLFCMRGGRITATTQSNYRLFHEILCNAKVPIALVFTGLEREAEMEDWWRRNEAHIKGYGIHGNGHACITAVQDDTPGEDLKYTESQKTIRELLKKCALRNTSYSPDALNWFARIGRGMLGLIEKRASPKRKKVLKVLVKRCKLDPETAKKIADMMEKGEDSTDGKQPTVTVAEKIEEENLPNPGPPVREVEEDNGEVPDNEADSSDEEGDSRHSEDGVLVPLVSDATSLGKATDARQEARGKNRGEESRSDAEPNAAGRPLTSHTSEHVATPDMDSADRAGTLVPAPVREALRLSDNPPNPDSAVMTTLPPGIRDVCRLRELPLPEGATRTSSLRSIKEDTRQTDGADDALPFPSVKDPRKSKEEPDSDGTVRIISSRIVRDPRKLKEESDPDDTVRIISSRIVRDPRKSKEEPDPDGTVRIISSRIVRDGSGQSREESHPDGPPYTGTGIGEIFVQPKRVPSPGSAGKTWCPVPEKTPNPDNGVRTWVATGPRDGIKRGSNADVAPRSGSHLGAGGSNGQPRNASSVAPLTNASMAAQAHTGRSDSSRQSSSRRSGAS